MTVRNRYTRLLPDNVLGSVLRENAREARRPRRRYAVDPNDPGGGGGSQPGSGAAWDAAILTTDADGTAVRTYPEPLPGTSQGVIVATVECSAPAIATVTQRNATSVAVAVHTISGFPVSGATVHVVTFPETEADGDGTVGPDPDPLG